MPDDNKPRRGQSPHFFGAASTNDNSLTSVSSANLTGTTLNQIGKLEGKVRQMAAIRPTESNKKSHQLLENLYTDVSEVIRQKPPQTARPNDEAPDNKSASPSAQPNDEASDNKPASPSFK